MERIRNLCVIAHVDHGKSTLCDRLLETAQNVDKLNKDYSQCLDMLDVERERGITVRAQTASLLLSHETVAGLHAGEEEPAAPIRPLWETATEAAALGKGWDWGEDPAGYPGDGDDRGSSANAPSSGPWLYNLIDTPGHVDFYYEVSRAMAACDGALLLVDAAQGVQAQTLSNLRLARAAGLAVLPVLTKVDLPGADPELALRGLLQDEVAWQASQRERESGGGVSGSGGTGGGGLLFPPHAEEWCLWTSAKTGEGTADVLRAIAEMLPPPAPGRGVRDKRQAGAGDAPNPDPASMDEYYRVAAERARAGASTGWGSGQPASRLRGFLFDSWHDPHRGSVGVVQVRDGSLKKGASVQLASTGKRYRVQDLGILSPRPLRADVLPAGTVGWFSAGIRDARECRVGDTLVDDPDRPSVPLRAGEADVHPLPGFEPARPMVFASVYPADGGDFEALDAAVSRLQLTDASLEATKERSASLGSGFRCGFLGLLHMDVVQERLRQEHGQEVVVTAPMAPLLVVLKEGSQGAKYRKLDFERELRAAGADLKAFRSAIDEAEQGSGGVGGDLSARIAALDLPETSFDRELYHTAGALEAVRSQGAAAWRCVVARRPDQMPSTQDIAKVWEPVVRCEVRCPDWGVAAVMRVLRDSRGEQLDMEWYTDAVMGASGGGSGEEGGDGGPPAVLLYEVPWQELAKDLFDQLKSVTKGYAAMAYEPAGFRESDVVKVDMVLNGKEVEPLSFVAPADTADVEGRRVAQRLRAEIKRQQFEVVIQALVGGKVVARERIAPYRKDVLTKSGKTVGGGDVSRKRKLLEKQKEGKARMKSVGQVRLSQEAFRSVVSSR